MGNSEVGHLTIGSGRILYQDLVRVSRAVEDGSLFENDALVGAFRRARERDGAVHLLGLVSNGGVHSHIDHLRALLELGRREGHGRAHLDPRVHRRPRRLPEASVDRPRDAAGRPDRDRRRPLLRDGSRQALGANGAGARGDPRRCRGAAPTIPSPPCAASYARGVTDEFVEPVVLRGRPRLDPARDAAIVFNFRPDRVRQLTERLLDAGVDVVTMTRYRDDFAVPGRVRRAGGARTRSRRSLAAAGSTQLHAAETEKYAHVTYFFNGGVEEPWPGEERILVPSPRDVPSYDHRARDVRRAGRRRGRRGASAAAASASASSTSRIRTWSATPGVIPAVVRAVETVDTCLAGVVEATHRLGGVCLVTADHGNAEKMLEEDGVSPHTAHTTNPVPLVLTRAGAAASGRRRAVRSGAHRARPARARAARRDDGHEPDRRRKSLTRHEVVNSS